MSQLEEVKKIINSLLMPHQNGLSAIALNNEFLEIEGRGVPWQSFGAESLHDFLLSLSDILVLGLNKAGARVFFPKVDEKTDHIRRLVEEQKSQPLKRRNEIIRWEVEKRPCREPSSEPNRDAPPISSSFPNQKFRNPSPPPPDPKNMLFRSSSPEKQKLKRPSPADSPLADPYEESLRRAREKRGIARRNHRSRRSRSRSLSPRRTKSPSPKRNGLSNRQISSPSKRRSPSPIWGSSPIQRRQRSPTPKRGNSPVSRRQRSPSPRWGNSPVQRRQRSPTPKRGNSPVERRKRSPSSWRGNSPVRRRQRSPSPRRGSSPVYRRQRSPSPRRGSSPVQRRQRSPVPPKIQTKSISCQTDFEKVSKSCQTEANNTHCISCQNNSKSHTPNTNHPPSSNDQNHDYSNVDENVDLNAIYYGTDYNAAPVAPAAPAFQCLYNPYSILPVFDPSYEEDTAHTEPGFYYDFDAGVHKPIPRIPEYYAYWIMAGWAPAVQDTAPQVNHAKPLPSSRPADPRVIPTPAVANAMNAKVRDPRLARQEARISPTEKAAARRKSLSINDYKNMRKLGANEESDKPSVKGNGETIEMLAEPVNNAEPVPKLHRDPRLRRAATK